MPGCVLQTFFLIIAMAVGQSEPRKAFEVASIKASPPITGDMAAGMAQLSRAGVKADSALASLTRVSLTDLVARAYHLEYFQVSGPDWMETAQFDIVAKLPQGGTTDSIPEMLQNLLIDRFDLKLHLSTKEFQVYTLRVGEDGLKLPLMTEQVSAEAAGGAISQSMDQCALLLSRAMGRPVLNQTGIEGKYVVPKELLSMLAMRSLWQRQGLEVSRPGRHRHPVPARGRREG